jgi:hypothetical protein
MHPLPHSYFSCNWCHGSGVYRARWCGCATRHLARERAACRDRWEELWVDQHRAPDHFPPTPIPRSSLCVFS